MSLLIFIAILVALIWVHELGHFAAAKLFKIRVDEFSIGFPPRLFSIRRGETRYSLGALLVGGYVSIHGENDQGGSADKRSMAGRSRPVQAAVVAAGVIMNLLFGWLALSAGYMAGTPAVAGESRWGAVEGAEVQLTYVLAESPAAAAGLEAGDALKKISAGSGEYVATAGNRGEDAKAFIAAHGDESLIFSVERAGVVENILVKPAEGVVEGKKAVGILLEDVGVLRLPPHLALLQGAEAAYTLTVNMATGLGEFLGRAVRGAAQWGEVSGPVGIASIGSARVEQGFAAAAFITALISLNLAIINLLPIPGLDGGRLFILLIESIIRRPLSQKLVGALSLAGFALIISLMIAVTYHDIAKLLG